MNRGVVRWLVLFFPLGLLLMWSGRCNWKLRLKCVVSFCFVLLALATAMTSLTAPRVETGGVQLVSLAGVEDLVGPTMDANAVAYEGYVPKYVPETSLLVEPTPTPETVWVYANNGGRYYHTRACRYTRTDTPRVTLMQALDAGLGPCASCRPFTAEEVYGYRW